MKLTRRGFVKAAAGAIGVIAGGEALHSRAGARAVKEVTQPARPRSAVAARPAQASLRVGTRVTGDPLVPAEAREIATRLRARLGLTAGEEAVVYGCARAGLYDQRFGPAIAAERWRMGYERASNLLKELPA